MNTNILCIEGLHLGQVDIKIGQIERGELHPEHSLSTLAVRRAGWGLERESIPATKWLGCQINRKYDDQDDWMIFTCEAAQTNPMPESKPLNPEHNICIKALLKTSEVRAAIRLAVKERHTSPFHIAVKRNEWPSDRTINGFDWKPELYTDWLDDWELWIADPIAFVSDYGPLLFYCIRSGMHISDIQETMNARCDELGALKLSNYHIRRDQWQSSQLSITADKWDIGKLWQARTINPIDLDATDWAIYNVPPPAEESRSDGETATVVMEMMRSLMQTDESWAWSWHCNLAMMAIDAGADRLSANCGAANFMRQAFEIDMTTSHLYRSLITGLEVERDKQSIEARRIDKILSGLTAFDVRRATPIICADRRIDRSKLWLRQASWTADKDSIQLDELKEHEPIKLSDPEPTDWEIWVNPHQQRSCEIQPAHAMIPKIGEMLDRPH